MKQHMVSKVIFVIVFVAGAALMIWGVSGMDSLSADFTRVTTGTPPDKTMWIFLGGLLAAAVGLFGLLRIDKI